MKRKSIPTQKVKATISPLNIVEQQIIQAVLKARLRHYDKLCLICYQGFNGPHCTECDV
jgi:hypothetical protein